MLSGIVFSEELFGTPERWGATTHSFPWAQVDVLVPGFTGATSFVLQVPCSYDLELAAAKYFYALPDGAAPLSFFKATGFFVPGVHSRPLSNKDPEIAPDLVPLRERLMAMVKRPVNIQASRDIVIQFRGDLLGQPYLTLFAKPDQLPVVEKPRA